MIRVLLIGGGCLAASWVLMIVLAARLPPGILKDLAGFLPACVTTIKVLREDPRVPRRAKIAIAIAGVWVISPIDLIPEFLPVIGPLDDIVVVALAFRPPDPGRRAVCSMAGGPEPPSPAPRITPTGHRFELSRAAGSWVV